MKNEIINKLNKAFNEPSTEIQEKGCLVAISETLDNLYKNNGSQSDFLVELRDFIIRYNTN